MTPLKELLLNYKSNHQAIPAFNLDSFEIYQAVEAAVADTKLPCLVQLSPHEDDFLQAEKIFLLVKKANLDGLPIYLNMDHGRDLNRLKTLVRLGFDLVHFDGSSLDYSTNLSQTTAFISEVKSLNPNCLVEVEINKINLVATGVSPESFTNPLQANEFVSRTGADLFAVSIGNLHGVDTKFPETIDLSLLQKTIQLLPSTFFTLHGGSGISSDQLQSAINLGIVKINFNTDLRQKFKQSLTANLTTSSSDKIYDYLTPVIADIKQLVIQKLIQFQKNV